MKPIVISSLLFSISLSSVYALSPGDLAFTAINADEDGWAMVALAAVPANTTVYFTDNEWDGSTFNTGESYTQWNSGGSIIPAGTVIRFSSVDTASLASSVGTLARATVSGSANWGLSTGEDSIYAYQASSVSAVPSAFVAAICNTSFGTASAGVLTNTGLGIGNGAIQTGFSGGSDFAEYNGLRSGQSAFPAYLSIVSNIANWTVDTSNGAYAATVPNTTPFTVTPSGPTSINLSTYVRVGRHDLPEPTRTTPPVNNLLGQEASGVTYNWDTDTLFIVGDGGTSVTEVTKTGALVSSMTLPPGSSSQGTEFFDTEGITYIGGGQFVMTEERDRQAVKFTYVAGGTLTRGTAQTVKLGTTIGNLGLEGLSYDPQTSGFLFVKEAEPLGIFQTTIDFALGTASNGSPSTVNSTNLFTPSLAGLEDMSDVFAFSNLPSMTGQPQAGNLLILSQESGMIRNVDRSGNILSTLTLVADAGNPLTIQNQTHEGVTMDRAGNIYVVSENGGGDSDHPQLWVFAPSSATNFAPTALALSNSSSTIPESTPTTTAIKMATLVVTDADGVGVNTLSVSGADAANFEIIGSGLYLKAGTSLDFSTKPTYSVTVDVDDTTVGNTPDASAAFTLNISEVLVGSGPIRVTEVAPWSSGNSAVAADWFELTNTSGSAVDITGWKMFDSGAAGFGGSGPLSGITSIGAGESVIFVDQNKIAEFISNWFGASPPPGLQVGTYGGPGLSTGGDAVTIFDGAGIQQARVDFGTAPSAAPFGTFDNSAGANGAAITDLSTLGTNGAFTAAATVNEIGSPGTAVVSSTPLINITATDASAAETASDPGTFRVTRTGSAASPLTVNYTVAAGAGQATSEDYTETLGGSVEMPASQSFVDITVTPIDDMLVEGAETVTLTVFDTGSYDVGFNATATVTILDNDAPNQAPTAVVLNSTVTTLSDATSTAGPVFIADISITDDGQGTNGLSLTGADAASFEITGSSLFLKASTVLNGFTKPSYAVTVNVDDTTVGSTPDASVAFTLNVTPAVGVGTIIISEISPWSSTAANSPLAADWFEITNTGTTTVNLTGWKMDDNSHVLSAAVALNGVTSIAPGEAVIFIETTNLTTAKAAFLSLWFGNNPPAGLQIGSYSGPGLSSTADEVTLFDAAGNRIAGVGFGASPTGPTFGTFDNHTGLNGVTDPVPTVSALSVAGIHGAITAANDTKEIGSPGIGNVGRLIVSEVSPWSSTAANSPIAADWFEVSNTGSVAVDITGWKVDDSSNLFTSALTLNGVTSIAPGESVIFIETADLVATKAAFLSLWFGINPPASLQVGGYTGSGIGLSGNGDAVNLFDSTGLARAGVTFGASPSVAPFATFDNAAGINQAAVSQLSSPGVNGATFAANDAKEIGSPGSIKTTAAFTLQLLHLADAEAGLLAGQTAPNLAALVDAFDGTYPNTLILAGGDNYIPGPFAAAGTDASVAATHTRGNNPFAADIEIHNRLGVEASTVGNHEFDFGTNAFSDAINDTTFPYLSSNLDFSGDAGISARYQETVATGGLEEASAVAKKIVPSCVVTKGTEKIGLVGVTTQILESISSTGGVEVKGFAGDGLETNDMVLLASQVQPVIADLKSQGVTKIVLMAHLQQITFEQQLAPLLTDVDIILAAGSNTRLGDSNDVAVAFTGHAANFAANYPIYTTGADGKPTVIVNTDNEFTYLGRLVADFDMNGNIITPNLLANTVVNGAYAATAANVASAWGVAEVNLPATAFAPGTKGALVKQITDAVQSVITSKDGDVRGYTDVYLEGERNFVRNQETNLGDITADSMVFVGQTALPSATHIASLKNGGGIRAAIGAVDVVSGNKLPPIANPGAGKPAGAVSLLDIENSLRFNNGLMLCDTTPAGLKAILEHGVALLGNQGRFPQIGGVRFSFDAAATAGSRILSAALIDEDDNITAWIVSGGVVAPEAPSSITLVTLNFLANGGDSYPFKANADNFRFLLDNGTLSAPVAETENFTAAGVVPANILGEQLALSNYLQDRYASPATAYDIAETIPALDTRIQQTAFRSDAVLTGPATFTAWLALNGYTSGGIDTDSDNDGVIDRVEYFFNQSINDGSDLGNLPVLTAASGEKLLTFTTNDTVAGVTGTLLCSDDLGVSDPWAAAVLNVDYEVVSNVSSGGQTTTTLRLLGPAASKFWRHGVSGN